MTQDNVTTHIPPCITYRMSNRHSIFSIISTSHTLGTTRVVWVQFLAIPEWLTHNIITWDNI